MIIYLLIFYLFDDFEKNIGITHADHSNTSNAILTKMHVHPERLLFYSHFALGIIHGDRCYRKTPNTIFFIQVNPLFWSLNSVTLLLFEEMLVLTSY